MPLVLSLATLAFTLALAVLLRVRWPRLSLRVRRALLLIAALLLAPCLLSLVSKWDVTNQRIADLEGWVRIVTLQFAIVFLTLLRPRLLTTVIAVVLLPFLFTTSIVGPLSYLFQPDPVRVVPIADGYVLETLPWRGVDGNSGLEYELSYRPPNLPGLRRGIYGSRLYDSQCTTTATYAVLRPETHAIDLYCPPLPPSHAEAGLSGRHEHHLIPRGALSPALRKLMRR